MSRKRRCYDSGRDELIRLQARPVVNGDDANRVLRMMTTGLNPWRSTIVFYIASNASALTVDTTGAERLARAGNRRSTHLFSCAHRCSIRSRGSFSIDARAVQLHGSPAFRAPPRAIGRDP